MLVVRVDERSWWQDLVGMNSGRVWWFSVAGVDFSFSGSDFWFVGGDFMFAVGDYWWSPEVVVAGDGVRRWVVELKWRWWQNIHILKIDVWREIHIRYKMSGYDWISYNTTQIRTTIIVRYVIQSQPLIIYLISISPHINFLYLIILSPSLHSNFTTFHLDRPPNSICGRHHLKWTLVHCQTKNRHRKTKNRH